MTMVKIVSDTSTLFSKKEGQERGLSISPLSISIDHKSYYEYEEISSLELLERIEKGAIPTSSQPSIGDKIAIYEKLAQDDDLIDITIAKGLSGTYDSALLAKDMINNGDRVTVFNSKTLCGPQRALVLAANEMAKEGYDKEAILEMLNKSHKSDISFLIPVDFSFLKRGGRVSKISGNLGQLLHLVPVMKKADDGEILDKFAISRTYKGALDAIFKEFQKRGVDDSYHFYITHAHNEELSSKALKHTKEVYPRAHVEVFELSPVFITQGGPGCMALQAIKIVR